MRYMVLIRHSSSSGHLVSPGYSVFVLLKPSFLFLFLWGAGDGGAEGAKRKEEEEEEKEGQGTGRREEGGII